MKCLNNNKRTHLYQKVVQRHKPQLMILFKLIRPLNEQLFDCS